MDNSMNISNNVGANSLTKNNAVVKRFFVPDIPAAYLQGSEGSVNQNARAEISNRQRRIEELVIQQNRRLKEMDEFEDTHKSFEALAEKYFVAENTRTPSEDQNRTIQELETSVSEIVLSGSSASGTVRDQTSLRIATKINKLKEEADAARKLWNQTCEDLESERKALNRARERSGLDLGPLQGGKMLYAPHRESRSMVKSSEDIIRDIWNLINGAGMLDLSFGRLHHHLTNLRKSIKHETRVYHPGKLKKFVFPWL